MRTMCVNCLNYEECDRPQGTCSVTKDPVLAWYGCRVNYIDKGK